jgi:hypothetical protein
MLPTYPEFAPISLNMRAELHPWFQKLEAGLSEFTFSNIWLFRHTYNYHLSRFGDGLYLLTGTKLGKSFFSAPWGLPDRDMLKELFSQHDFLKNINAAQAEAHGAQLAEWGYEVREDRDNWDYLYDTHEMATLEGKKFHKKRNHIHQFHAQYPTGFEGRDMDLSDSDTEAALELLERWQAPREDRSDYLPSKDAVIHRGELELSGRIWTHDGRTIAFAQGEPTQRGKTFTIHFEKADGHEYRGVYQTIFLDWSERLQHQYPLVNREQDLGDPGLRQAKETYRPVDYVRKFQVWPAIS